MAAPKMNIVNQEPKPNVRYTTYMGCQTVIFSKEYWNAAAAKCRLTMVGKFFKRKPKMTAIRASFSAKYPLKDHVKIVSFDSLHVFLDFTNEEDYDAIFFKETIIVAGAQMEVFRWTPEFHGPFVSTLIVFD